MNVKLWRVKRILTIFLVVCFSFCSVLGVSADTVKELQNQKKNVEKEKQATQAKLDDVQGDIEEISEEKEALEEELMQLDELLVNLILEVDLLESDIEDKKGAIEAGEKRYDEAVATINSQKEAMAKRIKYMYEKGNESYIEILLESKNMADAVNKVGFTEKLYAYDRMMLEQFQIMKREVEWAKNELETDLSELEEMEEDLNTQKKELDVLIEEKQASIEGFSERLSDAKSRAAAYEQQLKAQSSELKRINQEEQTKIAEEKRKAEEELARKKAEEAAKKKLEEDAKKNLAKIQEAAQVADSEGIIIPDEDEMVREGGEEVSASDLTGNADGAATVEEKPAETSSSVAVTAAGSGIGAEIANYGLQFVGNPYVSGGTSLTNGCDCSGFTQSVYAHFGISIPRSSYSQSEGGVEVPVSAMQAGDILYYGGHVGIYIGNSQIVHASTPSTGIKVSSASYRTIITVRRYY